MTVNGEKNSITVKNIMVGEVWICSGQSNMEMPLATMGWWKTGVLNYEQEVASANYPNDIRLFTVGKKVAEQPQSDCVGSWSMCTPETAASFSAVAYFFARELHKELQIPIGLIHTSWWGTPAEAWTSKRVIESRPDYKPIIDRYEKAVENYPQALEDYENKLAEWKKAAAKAKAEGKELPGEPWPPYGPGHQNSPYRLYNGMIAPLIPYGIQGVIWYQGESNAARAYQYRKLFADLIKNWRDDWGQGDFPFYYVQIAPFKSVYGFYKPFEMAELREAQLMTLSVPNTGMVVTMDIGDVKDIHPRNKQDVGKRLALWALAKTYGRENIVCSGPIYKSMKIEGDKIRLFFDYADNGLAAKGGELTHFVIAGGDKKFVDAKAMIVGNTVVVSSGKVSKPIAVRYAWSNAALPNFYNKEGLPASGFRTDDWPGVTFGKN